MRKRLVFILKQLSHLSFRFQHAFSSFDSAGKQVELTEKKNMKPVRTDKITSKLLFVRFPSSNASLSFG